MRKILIIDDEPGITQAFEDSFRYETDYEITSTNDGDQAIPLIKGKEPHLLVLDWRLRGEVEGKDILAFMKKEFPKTPVYVVTASVQFVPEIQSLGADACILKPCGDLKEKIKEHWKKGTGIH
jgi:DNA-binding response OmpR family regulator